MGRQNTSWSSIPNFFTKLFRAFMSSPPSLPFPIAGVFTPEKFVGHNSCNTCVWPDTLNTNRNNAAQAALCFVEQVEHFKNSDGKEHEYLRFRVSHPAGDRKAWIFAHRTVKASNNKDKSRIVSTALPSDSPSSSSSDITSPALYAEDQVIWATDQSHAYPSQSDFFGSCVRTITFSNEERFSVPQLGTLLRVTTESCCEYHLLNAQCYWFCEVVLGVLVRLFPRLADPKQAALVDSENSPTRKAGTFCGFEVHRCGNITAVYEAYLRKREAIEREEREEREREAEMRESQQKLVNAQKQANEAQSKTEEVRREAAEERCGREQAQREAEEAQREAEEARREAEEERRGAEEARREAEEERRGREKAEREAEMWKRKVESLMKGNTGGSVSIAC